MVVRITADAIREFVGRAVLEFEVEWIGRPQNRAREPEILRAVGEVAAAARDYESAAAEVNGLRMDSRREALEVAAEVAVEYAFDRERPDLCDIEGWVVKARLRTTSPTSPSDAPKFRA